MRFNEAGAIEPRNRSATDAITPGTDSFNEAGAIEPRNLHDADELIDPGLVASMRPGQ